MGTGSGRRETGMGGTGQDIACTLGWRLSWLALLLVGCAGKSRGSGEESVSAGGDSSSGRGSMGSATGVGGSASTGNGVTGSAGNGSGGSTSSGGSAGGGTSTEGSTTGGGGSSAAAEFWEGTHLLVIPAHNWTEPAGAGEDFAAMIEGFLLDVRLGSSTQYTVTVGLLRDGVQDRCSKTTTLPAIAAPPSIGVGPGEVEAYLSTPPGAPEQLAVVVTLSDFTLKDVLPDGSTPAEDGVLTASVDMREMYPLFYQLINSSADGVCAAFESSGSPCEPCADGAPYCQPLVAEGLGATPFSADFEAVPESCPPLEPQ